MKKTSIQAVLSLVLVTALAGALAGCGKAVETATEYAIEKAAEKEGKEINVELGKDIKITGKDDDGNAINYELKGGATGEDVSMTFESEDGTSVQYGAGAKMPENFPKDVPQHDALELVGSQTQGDMFMIQGKLKGDLAGLKDYYAKASKEQGWEETSTMSQAGMMEMIAYKKADRVLNITLMNQNGEIMINLHTGKE